MTHKKIYATLTLICIIGILALSLIHKAHIDRLYRGFEIKTVEVSDVKNKITPNMTIKKFKQYRKSNEYYAELTVDTANKMSLSLAHWYLLEGQSVQPNQFISDDLTINGRHDNILTKGTNVIKINTQVDQGVRPNLVIVTNPDKGKYTKFMFKTLN